MQGVAHLFLLGLAGAVGTLLRHGCTSLATRLCGVGFPWGTLAVNLVGSLAFGLIVGLSRSRGWMGTGVESVLLIGLLGGFTTYSSYAFQAVDLMILGRGLQAAAYMVVTNIAALAAVWVGIRLGTGR